MNGLFCYDGTLFYDDGSYYGIALNDEMFKRYYCIVDSLTAAVRTADMKASRTKYDKLELDNFYVRKCPNLNTIKGFIFDRRRAKAVLSEEIEKSDIIIARLPSNIGAAAINIAKKMEKPYLIELVGCPWDAFWNHSLKGKIIAPYMYFITKKLVREAKYVLYVTSEFLQRRYPTKGKNIACSNVILPEIDPAVLERRLRKIENAKGKLVIGTIAAIDVRYKGQEYIIKAISRLNKQGFDFEYRLVGGGSEAYLKAVAEECGVSDKVKFMGTLPHDKVFDWLDTIDIYAQPSKQEGMPRALIEAMSRGCPAIGSTSGGIPELLDKKYLFKNADVNGICGILSRFNREDMAAQAKRNFDQAKNYDKSVLAERRSAFYREFADYAKSAGGKND